MLNILVTGADGQLGRELRKLGAASENNCIFTDIRQLNITDGAAVEAFVGQHNTDVIINCAAYTNVNRAEEDEAVAYAVNCLAVRNLAVAAAKHKALLVHISTDYVFDGRSRTPYTEEMPVSPLNAYGRTKLAGEAAVAESGCRHIILRTAWLHSEFGRNFVKSILHDLKAGNDLRVVTDQIGTPTYAADLAEAIFDIVENGKHEGNDGVYHFSNEGECSWYDFACAIAEEAGNVDCRLSGCRTWEYPSKVVRPCYSVLDKSKFRSTFRREIPTWQDAMKRCVRQIRTNPEWNAEYL